MASCASVKSDVWHKESFFSLSVSPANGARMLHFHLVYNPEYETQPPQKLTINGQDIPFVAKPQLGTVDAMVVEPMVNSTNNKKDREQELFQKLIEAENYVARLSWMEGKLCFETLQRLEQNEVLPQ